MNLDVLMAWRQRLLRPGAMLKDKAMVREWLQNGARSSRNLLGENEARAYIVEHYRNLIQNDNYPGNSKLEKLADILLGLDWRQPCKIAACERSVTE